mmetsp:Transcript_12187/g.31242  ORF Transcript_12187/g.31242 Transcript_12187/m.31242 type:complete len:131 (+) Transcript_12187:99-491(+)
MGDAAEPASAHAAPPGEPPSRAAGPVFGDPSTWEVGDRVQVIFGNNALGNYFDGKITQVHEEIPLNHTHWFAEKAIALYYLCCCHVCLPMRRAFDIEYDDGRREKKVSPELIRPPPPRPTRAASVVHVVC